MAVITSQKLGAIEKGIKTSAESISVVPASGSNPATSTLQTLILNLVRNLNAVSCTGTWAGGTADNATISGTIAAPGAGKAIFLKNITFSYGATPASVRIFTVTSASNDLVNFAITAGGVGFVSVGIAAPTNTAVTFSMPASGAAGVLGRLRIYYSIVDVIA